MPSFLFLLNYFCIGHQCGYLIPEAILMNLDWNKRKPLIEEFVFDLLVVEPPPSCKTISLTRKERNYLSIQIGHSLWQFSILLGPDNRIRFYRGSWPNPAKKEDWLNGLQQQFQLVRLMTKIEEFLEKGCWNRVPYQAMHASLADSLGLIQQSFAWKDPHDHTLLFVHGISNSEEDCGFVRFGLEFEDLLFILTLPQQTIRRRLVDARTGLEQLSYFNYADSNCLLYDIERAFASC